MPMEREKGAEARFFVDYTQIVKVLRDETFAGAYSAPEAFPSLTKIMKRFGVSRPSAVRVVAELKRMGIVRSLKGAGTFVTRRNWSIGLAIPGTADSEFFLAVKDALVSCCEKSGMTLVQCGGFAPDHGLRDEQAEKLARRFASAGVAGVVMQPVGFSEKANSLNARISALLDEANIPVVLIDYDIVPPPGRSRYDVVAIDNFAAGRKLAAHLVASGAKRVCCLLRRLCADSVRVRFAGVDEGVFRATGSHARVFVAEPDDRAAIASALARHRPDAIVCPNDLAAGMLARTFAKLKIRVPGDVMLAGFDDVKSAAEMKPGLTSIRQPCSELAAMAFRTLMERIKNPKLPPRNILLDTTLVERESTRRI